MISETQFKSMSRTLSLIVDCESAARLLQERIKFASSVNNDDLLTFIYEEIVNTNNIIDKKIYDVLLDERLANSPGDTCSDEK